MIMTPQSSSSSSQFIMIRLQGFVKTTRTNTEREKREKEKKYKKNKKNNFIISHTEDGILGQKVSFCSRHILPVQHLSAISYH